MNLLNKSILTALCTALIAALANSPAHAMSTSDNGKAKASVAQLALWDKGNAQQASASSTSQLSINKNLVSADAAQTSITDITRPLAAKTLAAQAIADLQSFQYIVYDAPNMNGVEFGHEQRGANVAEGESEGVRDRRHGAPVDLKNIVFDLLGHNYYNTHTQKDISSYRLARLNTFNADGTQIVTTAADNTAKVWSTNSGACLLTLHDQNNAIQSAEFSHDGTKIVTTSTTTKFKGRQGYDEVIEIWNAQTGALVHTLRTALAPRSAQFSPDGKRALTASDRYANNESTSFLEIWDARTGKLLDSIKIAGHVDAATFSQNGKQILTKLSGGTVQLWEPVHQQFIEDLLTERAIAEQLLHDEAEEQKFDTRTGLQIRGTIYEQLRKQILHPEKNN